MWIVDQDGLITSLAPNRRYLIGRDTNADFIVNSTSVSRQQLELELGDARSTTPIWLSVLSRARSVINGDAMKLSKSDKDPIKKEYTSESPISIVFKDNDKQDHLYFVIRWIDLNIWTTSPLDCVDARLYREYDPCVTHYFGSGDGYLEALARGIPVLGSKWLGMAKSGSQWISSSGYGWVSSDCVEDVPRKERASLLDGITCVVPRIEEWMKLMGGNVILEGDEVPSGKVLVIKDTKELESALKNCSLSGLKIEKPHKRNHTDDNSQPSRKRVKYERVSRMHFFDLEPQVNQEKEVTEGCKNDNKKSDNPKSDNKSDSPKSDNKSESPKSEKSDSPKSDNKSDNQPIDVPPTPPVTKKRSASPDLSQISKYSKLDFKPKVSLVDAVKQTRETAKQTSNMELGVPESDVAKDLGCLTIVEEITVPVRTPVVKPPAERSTRKNFKNFKKSAPIHREVIGLATVTVDSDFKFQQPPRPEAETQKSMEKDFSGLMSEVKSLEPNLFVQDDESDDGIAPMTTEGKISDNDDDDDDDQPKFGFSRA